MAWKRPAYFRRLAHGLIEAQGGPFMDEPKPPTYRIRYTTPSGTHEEVHEMPDRPPTAEEQAEALRALAGAMKRWGVKPEDLKPPYRELMAFTPDEVQMADEPKPLTAEELELLETLARFDPASVPEARAQKALVLRLVAEVRRLRAELAKIPRSYFIAEP